MIRNNLLALAFFVCGGAMVWALDRSMDRSELEELALITEITGEQLQLRLETCIAPRLSLINQLTYGWDSWDSVNSNWQLVANSTFGILSGIQALNLVDMSRTIRQVYPYDGNEQALGADLTQHPSPDVNITLNEAQRTDQLQRTTTLELLQSGAGFAIYKQIRSNTGEALGFVNGVFRVDDLLSTCFSEQNLRDQFIYRIFEQDNRNIFSSAPNTDEAAWRFSTRNEVDVAGHPWILELAPSTAQFRNVNSFAENLWMTVGLLLVLLLALAIRALLNNRDFLDDSQARYRLLVENQSDLIIKLDPAGKLLYASPSFCRVVEKTESELLEVDFLDLIHGNDRNAVRQALFTKTTQPGYSARTQRARMAIDGRWTEWSSSTVVNSRQEIDCIVAVGRDITEQKAMEEQVAHSQKMRAVGEMAGGISHDFNNLLQVILANIELLLANNERSDKGLRLKNVRSAVNSGIELTQRLSTLSRQDSMSTETVNLNQLLSESTNLIARSLPATITLEYSATAGPLKVKGNRSQLERVLFNLCFNARDAIQGDGSIQVKLHAMELDPELYNSHPELRQGHYALIQVRDNGSGIDEAILPRIFEPFFTTKRKEQGSGLGLANCYSIAAQHGGIITVASTSGQGTCFDLYLPLAGEQEALNKTDASLASPPAGSSQQTVNKTSAGASLESNLQRGERQPRILVADDNEDLLQTIRSFLELETYAVSTVDNGLKAVELVSQEDSGFDLIILDLVMPGISGQEAATRIRMYSADVPILFISGYIPERDMAAGMDRERLLRKPFTRQELLTTVAEALGSNAGNEGT